MGAAERAPSVTLARNAFYLVVGQAATTALAIVLSSALGRSLGAHDFGVYYLITTMATFAYVFVEWGQPTLVIPLVARAPQRSGELLGSSLALRVVLAVAVSVVAALISWTLGYGAQTTGLAVFMILASLPLFLAQSYGMVFRAHDRMGKDATVSVANKAVALCVALPALALGLGIPGVILALAVAGAAALVVARRLYARAFSLPLRMSWDVARELLRDGAPILAMTAATSAQPYLDAILLSKLAPPSVVGWYGAAKTILGTMMAPATILGMAAYPRLARASADPTVLRREVRAAFRPLLLLGALAGTGTYLFADVAIALIYGARVFAPAAMILKVFAPALFLVFIDVLLGNILYAAGRGTGFAVAKVASVVVGSTLDLLLIPVFQERFANGGIGVVVAFAFSELFVFGGAMIVMRRWHALEPAIAVDVARALGAAGVTILLLRLMSGLPAGVALPLCVVVFVGASLALGLVRRRDLELLRALVPRTPGA
jgi:O-antigen/teichoic acid export membrane protein